ncbi:P-loop containing nucleoside triphosphate hydrolase protein [Nemania sp. FL0031]|nr:P-loop containing nucleoside triphosphate hydrolase protein [Nemania sp. FL0031]
MSSVIQNASIDRASTQEEFERQVWQLKRSNGEYLSALNRLGSLHGARDIVDLEEQIEVVSQSVEDEIEQQARQAELKEMKAQQDEDNPEHETDVPQPVKSEAPEAKQEIKSAPHTAEDVEYWKRTAQQYEQTLKAQTELTQTREAALVAKHEAQIRSFTERYRNLVEELAAAKGSIRLMCRIKPEDAPTENSLKFTNGDEQPFLPWGKLRVTYQNESQKTDNRDFDFQRVFGNGESNQEVFEQVKDFAKSAALGNSASIMAYGATGTGKSYLFLAEDGLVLSYIRFLFQLADEERNYNKYDISISAIEIYLNKIYDLLQAPVANQKVEVRLTAESTTKLESEQEAIDIVKQAIDRREAASTKQNATSSRSHFIIAIKISKKSLVNPREKPVESVLSFADLAGSEAAGRNLLAGSSGIQYEQAQDINQGLLDLGKGVRGLATKGPFFASHNLTRALKSSLSPGSRLLLITTVSPLVANQNNTLTTLRWSQDAIGPRPSPARQWPPVATPSRVPLRTSTSNSSSSSARLPPKGLGVIKRDPSPSTSGRPSPPSVRPRPSFSNTPKR